MRTIKLSDEQIQAISHALGIAEQAFTNQYRTIAGDLVNVRGTHDKPNQLTHASYFHEWSCIFADINEDLTKGKLDV